MVDWIPHVDRIGNNWVKIKFYKPNGFNTVTDDGWFSTRLYRLNNVPAEVIRRLKLYDNVVI